jgi:S-adenosyl-L-methionine hydrolase (adenosine-forming)
MAIYTITSDLGKENYLTAIVKGCIYEQDINAKIVEISSEIEPFDVYQATYLFQSAFAYFPKKSHHFILCGLYNTEYKQLLIAEIDDAYVYFVDNGFASLAMPENIIVKAIKLDNTFAYNVGNIAKTFAMASFYLGKGTKITDFTIDYQLQYQPTDIKPVVLENQLIAQVLFIDRFKNIVINITKAEFESIKGDRKFVIEFVGREKITEISNGYNDVEDGRKVVFFNTAGYLEIAVRNGNASELFGFETGKKIDDLYKTIKIFFE